MPGKYPHDPYKKPKHQKMRYKGFGKEGRVQKKRRKISKFGHAWDWTFGKQRRQLKPKKPSKFPKKKFPYGPIKLGRA